MKVGNKVYDESEMDTTELYMVLLGNFQINIKPHFNLKVEWDYYFIK